MAPPSLRWVFDRTHARLSACAACSLSRGRAHEAREAPAKMRWLLYWRPVATFEGHSRGSLGPGARRRRRPGGPAPAGATQAPRDGRRRQRAARTDDRRTADPDTRLLPGLPEHVGLRGGLRAAP